MVTVVKQGKEVPRRVICGDCCSELEYFKGDIKGGRLSSKYIKCPICLHEVFIYYPSLLRTY